MRDACLFVVLCVCDVFAVRLPPVLRSCDMAPSRAKLMVAVMVDLQRKRQGSRVFAGTVHKYSRIPPPCHSRTLFHTRIQHIFPLFDEGKNGFITPRDLFRWATRGSTSTDKLASEGYMLLAECLRKQGRALVQCWLIFSDRRKRLGENGN